MVLYDDPILYDDPTVQYDGNALFSQTLTEIVGMTEQFSRQVSWARTLTDIITQLEILQRFLCDRITKLSVFVYTKDTKPSIS